MPRILVNPDQLRALSAQLQQVSNELRSLAGRVNGAWNGLDWEVRHKATIGGQVSDSFGRAHALARQAATMAGYLLKKAQAFEEADRQGVMELNDVISKYPIPVPTPTPAPEPGQDDDVPASVKEAIEFLDDLLKPIDWISDHKKATKTFRETLKQLGRTLNTLTGKRGHVKLMEELADVLTGTAKAVSATSDLLDLQDFQRYFTGEITNQEIARTAIQVLIPIPFLDDKIADWLARNVPDPNGKWRGLVRGAG